MTEELPTPKSRREEYLAKAAGMEVEELPTPASREEMYLDAIAQGGGGGGTSDFDELTNRPKYNGTAMTSETDIPVAPTVVQVTGTSQTDVMSQDATTKMVFNGASGNKVQIGNGASATGYAAEVAIGKDAKATSTDAIGIGNGSTSSNANTLAIGKSAEATGVGSIGIGALAKSTGKISIAIGGDGNSSTNARAQYDGSVAIGAGARATAIGEFNIGSASTSYGYNSTKYRLLSGLYDPQSDHDAATKGYVDGLVGDVATALNAINNGTGA